MAKKKPAKPAKEKSTPKESSDALLTEAAAEQKREQLARQDTDTKRRKSILDRAKISKPLANNESSMGGIRPASG